MNKFNAYNDTKIPKGESVTFELLDIKEDPLNKGYKIIPLTLVPPKDIIYVGNELYEIGASKGVLADGTYNLVYNLLFTPDTGGKIILSSGNVEHEVIYKYFTWCNFNQSNPNRDTSRPAIFRCVDAKKEELQRKENIENVIKAKALIMGAEGEALSNLEKTFGVSGKDALYNVAEAKATEILGNTPKKKVEVVEDTDIVKTMSSAFKRKKLQINYIEKTVSFNKEVVFTYSGDDLDKKELGDYLTEHRPDVIEGII